MKKTQLNLGMGKRSRQFGKCFLITLALLVSISAGMYNRASAATYLTEIKIEDDNNVYWDRFLLVFDSSRYDFKDSYDAIKWTNAQFNFYTYSSDNQKLAIDCRPYVETKRVKVGFTTPYQKTYYLRVVDHSMPVGTILCFRDNYADTTVTFTTGMKYYFTVTGDPLSQGDSRFEFVCSKPYTALSLPFAASLSAPPLNPYSNSSAYVIYKGYGPQSFTFSASASGGKAGYTYTWSPSTGVDSPAAATATLTPQITTTYTITVKDANDSIKTFSRTIYVADATCGTGMVSVCSSGVTNCVPVNDVPGYLGSTGNYLGACLTANPAVTNLSCYGQNNGSINMTVNGAVSPYTYSWSNGATTEDLPGLIAGSYTLSVSSIDGRSVSKTIAVTQPVELVLQQNSLTNVTCYGDNNGSVNINATGGVSPYTYLWNDNNTNNNRTGLVAGNYSVTVTDLNGCTGSSSYSLTQPPAIDGAVSISPLYSVLGHDSATIYRGYGPQSLSLGASVSGGTPPYAYKWLPAARVSNPYTLNTTATPTVTTIYTLTVTDANGCTESFSYKVYVVNAKCGNNSHPKVRVCYNGNNLCVSLLQASSYLLQGATLGYCGSGNKGEFDEDNDVLTDDILTEVKVYPNPSTGIFNIQLPGDVMGGQVNVMDMNGRVVKQTIFAEGSKISVDMKNHPAGIYMMMITNATDTHRLRITLID